MTVHPLQQHRYRFDFGDAPLFSVYRDTHNVEIDINEEIPEGALASVSKGIARTPAKFLFFHGVTSDQTRPKVALENGQIIYTVSTYEHHCIDLEQSFEAYKKKFSSKTRSTLQRKIRKLEQFGSGALSVRRFTLADEIDEFFALAKGISKETYQEKLLDLGLPSDPQFVAQAKSLARADALRAFVLFHDNRPMAYLYCPVKNNTLIYAHLGHLPETSHLSVGTVLQWRALESIFAEQRFKTFDFTEGENEHKRLFSSRSMRRQNILMLPISAGNLVFVYAHLGCAALSRGLGIMFGRLGLKRAIKRFLRRQGAERATTSA